MAADALAQALVARSSAAMVLAIYVKHFLIFHVEELSYLHHLSVDK